MTEKIEQASDGVASKLNAELGLNVGDAVTVLLHGDDNEYTGTVTNPKKLWVELHDYGRPFIADECSIKTIKLKYTFNDAIFKSDEVTVKKRTIQ
jgi:hypothetical protein